MTVSDQLDAFCARLESREQSAVARVASSVLWELQSFALDSGFVQLLPVMISPFTDPLNHSVYPAFVEYEGREFSLTASMIFHKQLALSISGVDRVFIVSPNIRLEKASVKNSSNHLIEFSQFDLEMSHASMSDVIAFVDRLVRTVLRRVNERCAIELSILGRKIPDFDTPFPVYNSSELRQRFGESFEACISRESSTPCFVTNFRREFYDRENPEVPGQYNNFDLIYPEGYGEALSGAEREFEHRQILRRMRELDMPLEPYATYIEAARRGRISPSAGAGLGIQRFVKYVCGLRHIREACVFDRSISSEFVF